MRHILRFDTNKYRPMFRGELTQGHIAEAFCWCRPHMMMSVAGGAAVYLHKEQACANYEHCEKFALQANCVKCTDRASRG